MNKRSIRVRDALVHASLALALVLSCAISATPQEGAPNTLAPQESKEGWRLLFNGRNLDGWEARLTAPNPQKGSHPDWTVADGAMICGGGTPSWIGTTDSFSNYVLKVEFRGKEGVNSGVFLRSQKEGAPHKTGYELQIWDNQPAGYNTGSLVGAVKAQPAKIIPDKWNQYEITTDGDHITAVLNGKKILDAHDSSHASGVVGLQCQHDNRIEFRNIKLLPR